MLNSLFVMLLAMSETVMQNFNASVGIMAKGMLGIMVVILILTLIVSLISRLDNKKPTEKKDSQQK